MRQEKELEDYLYQEIPISKAIGVQVVSASTEKVILSAPLGANINHKQTAFGGSLHAVATLACWSLLHLRLQSIGRSYQIVITKSEVDYVAPVDTDFQAVCQVPDEEVWQRFMKILKAKGKARLQLSATIECHNRCSVKYQALFAAI